MQKKNKKVHADNKVKARSATRKLEQQSREQGGLPNCVRCPKGIKGRFTPKKDGAYFKNCDYHRALSRRSVTLLWDFKKSLIDPETQALCKHCTDVFKPEQMMQKWNHVHSKNIAERQSNLCPHHFAVRRVMKGNFVKCTRRSSFKRCWTIWHPTPPTEQVVQTISVR